jgi:predicted O-linked N-acetylglucosamine transferase (SPINDLY family)
MTPQELLSAAQSFHQSGDLAAAEVAYRQILAATPYNTAAWSALAEILYRTGRNAEALETISQAAQSSPTDPAILLTHGIILNHEGRFDEAIAVFGRVIGLHPGLPEGYSRIATPLLATGRAEEAFRVCRRSLALRPDHMPTVVSLCNALSAVGDLDEVVSICRQALSRHPNYRTLYLNLGWALREQGKLDEAIAAYRDALGRGPDKQIWDDLLFTVHFHPAYDRQALFNEHRAWAEGFAKTQAGAPTVHTMDRSENRRLRLGYVAHDLGNNPLGRFLLPLFAHHDKSAFEVFVYCDRRRTDAVGGHLHEHADTWRTTGALSDERLAEQIRNDRIDVLVDLIMHSNGSRLLAFARKPAPVQVTYLAYASTTGLDTIDYRLTDHYLDPPRSDQSYSEKSVYLPDCYWCYPPPTEAPVVGPPPFERNGHIAFGCLNEFSKVTPDVLSKWSQILGRVQSSRLVFHTKPGSQRSIAARYLDQNGIDPSRITFVPRLGLPEYFATYNQIDIALDPFPYAGGTTTFDALYMGVPVVTLEGKTGVGRGGVSILSNLSLEDLIAPTPEHYIATAVALARDPARLTVLRQNLRSRLLSSPLCDARRFAGGVEALFLNMWRDFQ